MKKWRWLNKQKRQLADELPPSKRNTWRFVFNPTKLARLQALHKAKAWRLFSEQLLSATAAASSEDASDVEATVTETGWRGLIAKLRGQKAPKKRRDLCGIVIMDNGIAVAHIKWQRDGSPILQNCLYRKAIDSNEIKNILIGIIDRYRLRNCEFSWILLPPHYQLLQIPTPNTPPEQLKFAARQEVKDFLTIPFEEAAIEVFHMPPHGASGFQKKVFVVVASILYLQQERMIYAQNQLDLKYIDIDELAMRNIASLYVNDDDPSFAILHCQQEASFLYVGEQHDLFLSHRIDINMDRIVQAQEGDLKALSGEIKRAMDYYTSQIGKAFPERILLVPTLGDNQALLVALNDKLDVNLELIDLNLVLACNEEWPIELQAHCLTAVGGALRQNG